MKILVFYNAAKVLVAHGNGTVYKVSKGVSEFRIETL